MQQILTELKRCKKAFGDMLLHDWTGSRFCGSLVEYYLHDNDTEPNVFGDASKKMKQIVKPLEHVVTAMFQMVRADANYLEAVGIVRLSRQLEVGLEEIAYVAKFQGRQRLQEEFSSGSLFFQYF